jgi:hypothetical protein
LALQTAFVNRARKHGFARACFAMQQQGCRYVCEQARALHGLDQRRAATLDSRQMIDRLDARVRTWLAVAAHIPQRKWP